MRQRWEQLSYLHWPVAPNVVQAMLPSGLEVDTHDGMAWVGLVPFQMRSVGPVRGPAVPISERSQRRTFVPTSADEWVPGFGSIRSISTGAACARGARPCTAFRTSGRRCRSVRTATASPMRPYGDGHIGTDHTAHNRSRRRPDPERPSHGTRPLPHRPLAARRSAGEQADGGSGSPSPVAVPPSRCRRPADGLVAAGGYPQPDGEPHVLYSPGVSVLAGRPTRA